MVKPTKVTNSIRALRESAGLTQIDLASRVGVTRQTLIAIEQGHSAMEILAVMTDGDSHKVLQRPPAPSLPVLRQTFKRTVIDQQANDHHCQTEPVQPVDHAIRIA